MLGLQGISWEGAPSEGTQFHFLFLRNRKESDTKLTVRKIDMSQTIVDSFAHFPLTSPNFCHMKFYWLSQTEFLQRLVFSTSALVTAEWMTIQFCQTDFQGRFHDEYFKFELWGCKGTYIRGDQYEEFLRD